VPKSQLRFARAEEVSENLVVMLGGAAFFDEVAFPARVGIKMRIRILPPPDFAALPVAPKDDVGRAVAIDVHGCATGLDGQEIRLNNVAIPAGFDAAAPDQRGRDLPERENKIVRAVLVQIG